mgnify:CR=1 FL=1|tara:strand:+ start:3665 stop:3940 length:276 start_codon:yes stop_codon:yes gene_type:complete
MDYIRNIVREVLSEIVSTEVDRAPGGGPDVQKNQSGYGYSGNQNDAPKQERKNDTHIYFNNVTSSAGGAGGDDSSDTVEESEELEENDDFI